MKKFISLIILQCWYGLSAYAQFTDNFSDGDYALNPTWNGDIAKFEINGDSKLHLNAPAVSSEAYLSTRSEAIAHAVWQFDVQISENPSSTNFTNIYLISEQADLRSPTNAYYVRIGGSTDEVSLYRQDGSSSTELIDGTDDRVDTKPVAIQVRITRDEAGNWSLYSKTPTESSFVQEGSYFDNTYTAGQYFGVYCKYTSTRSSAFYFDNFEISGGPVPDNTSPSLTTYQVVNAQAIRLTFSEELDNTTATNPDNYQLNGLHPSSVLYQDDSVYLELESPLPNGVEQILTITNIADPNGNVMPDSTLGVMYFVPVTPSWQSIVVNEFMADPTPARLHLPDDSQAEYIELYNADPHPYDLEDWQINGNVLPSYILHPGAYVILCREAFRAEFSKYADVLVPDQWPSLTNSGSSIALYSKEMVKVDSLSYDSDLVSDGASTERVYVNPSCSILNNYAVSTHENGGTPGLINSVYSDAYDDSAPELQAIISLSYDTIRLDFDEKVYLDLQNKSQVLVDGTVSPSRIAYPDQDSTRLLLIFENELAANRWHSLTIELVEDCEGNQLVHEQRSFYLDLTPPSVSDVILRDTAQLEIRFTEKIDKNSAEKESNYLLFPYKMAPRRAVLTDDSLAVTLDFATSFNPEVAYTMAATGVVDIHENTIPEGDSSFYQFKYRDDLDSLKIINAYQIALYFSQAPDISSMTHAQYMIDRSVGAPARILSIEENQRLLHLILSKPLDKNRTHQLRMEQIRTEKGNLLSTPLRRFFYDTKGPQIEKANATSEHQLLLSFDEVIQHANDANPQLWINGETVLVDSVLMNDSSLFFVLTEPLPGETLLEIGVSGIIDRYQNDSDPEQDFAFFFDISPPHLDTAYFISPTEILLKFHEPLLRPDQPSYQASLTWTVNLDKGLLINFLTSDPHTLILQASALTNTTDAEIVIHKIADLYGNEIKEPLTVYIENTEPKLSLVKPWSDHQLLVQFSRDLEIPLADEFLLDNEAAISIEALTDYQYIITFDKNLIPGMDYKLNYLAQSFNFSYQHFIEQVEQGGPATLSISWQIPLHAQTAESVENFLLNGNAQPATAVYIESEQLLKLIFEKPFESNQLHSIKLMNLADLDGFPIPISEHYFGQTQVAQAYELIITEIMADPNPTVSLPNAEYVELYNTSGRPISLNSVQFSDQNQTVELSNDWLLPGEYIIVCDEEHLSEMASFGRVMALRSFPNLNAKKDHLRLTDQWGNSIHEVAYQKSWYNDAYKQEGGWSLEMVDVDYPCRDSDNWTASKHPDGGSPGKENAARASNPDQVPPVLQMAVYTGADQVRLYFDEKIGEKLSAQFEVKLEGLTLEKPYRHSDFRSVVVEVPPSLELNFPMEIEVTHAADCSGNVALEAQTVPLIIPQKHQFGNVLISELLFQPRSGGVEFVEIYNNSDHYIDMQNWKLALQRQPEEEMFTITGDVLILPPHSYLALTSSSKTLVADYPAAADSHVFTTEAFPNLPAAGDTLMLIDSHEALMQTVPYHPDWHHPLLKDPKGVSLERISWTMSEGDFQAWESAASTVGFATPGYQNSQRMPLSGTQQTKLAAEPPIFFPDQSGIQDFTRITLSSLQVGSMLNLKIFDIQGRLVRELVQNQTFAEENEFIWDGTDQLRRRARDGQYIIWAETFDMKGQVSVYKTKVAVGSRY